MSRGSVLGNMSGLLPQLSLKRLNISDVVNHVENEGSINRAVFFRFSGLSDQS